MAVGLHGQVAVADDFIPRQSPPTVTISDVYQVTAEGTEGSATFTRGSVVTSLQPGKENSSGTQLDRTLYEVDVDVTTNGDLDSITLVSLCLVQQGTAPDSSTDLSTPCGFGDDSGSNSYAALSGVVDPTTTLVASYHGGDEDASGSLDSPDEDYAFAIEDDGQVEHGLESVVANDVEDDTTTPEAKKRTVTFRFDLSHAMTNSTGDWYLRAVAVTQPPKVGGETTAPATQWAQAVQGFGSSGGGDVLYYGGITSTRAAQNYGPINVEGTSTKTAITTGDYLANDSSNITLSATDFSYSDDTLPLGASADSAGTVKLECVETTTADANPAISLSSSNQVLKAAVGASSLTGTAEDAVAADTHGCTLTYGGGAVYGNQTYSNTVTVGIYDTDDTGYAGSPDDLGSTSIAP